MHYKVLGYKKKFLSEISGKKENRLFLWSFLSVGKNYASEKNNTHTFSKVEVFVTLCI